MSANRAPIVFEPIELIRTLDGQQSSDFVISGHAEQGTVNGESGRLASQDGIRIGFLVISDL